MKAVVLSACLLAGPAVAKLSGATINAVFQDTSSLTGFDETYARAYDLLGVSAHTHSLLKAESDCFQLSLTKL